MLISNWREVLRRAWSVRLLLLAGILSAAEIALPIIREIYMVPTGLFLILSMIATASALIARIVAQKSTKGDA